MPKEGPKKAHQENRIAETSDPAPQVETPKRTAPTLEFLPVPYTDAEILVFADKIARLTVEKQNSEEQFEVVKLNFKHTLEALEAAIRDVTRKITKRAHYENVDCIYQLETPTTQEKTLIRRDTGEVVRVVPMDSRDYQDPLPAVMKPDQVDATDSFSLAAPDVKSAAAGDKEEKEPVQ